jgi:hypothetical protein
MPCLVDIVAEAEAPAPCVPRRSLGTRIFKWDFYR